MRDFQLNFRQVGVALCTAFLVSPLQLQAAPLELAFRPPDIAPQVVCTPRPSDADTIAFWQNWDGKPFAGMSSATVKRDIKRLQHIDAKAWVPTIEQMINLLVERDKRFAGKNALLTHIQALQAAGQFERIRSLQLVPRLAENSEKASPRIQNALSDLFRDGIGVDRDIALADRLLVQAGYSGNADALLTLSKRALEGEPVAGWDVPTELAVTMAFGSLVGELNATICDRTARIAREYRNGGIVQQDPKLAHDWYRFTADLGDANAAWKVVEYHMQAEEFAKDNATLLKYLQQAADAQLPFAQIELGRIYESGALLPLDLDKALELFRQAASSNFRSGLTRLALFLEDHADRYQHLQDERVAALRQLADRDDAPGWVFTRLAAQARADKGHWRALPEMITYLEKASALDDMEGKSRLALALLANRQSPQDFERATDLLAQVVSVHGGVTPSKQLYNAYMCQSKTSPRVAEAHYWKNVEAATDTANIALTGREIVDLAKSQDAKSLAVLQSQALYGRPSSLASWLKFIELADYGDAPLEPFWRQYADRFPLVLTALAKLERELATTSADHQTSVVLFEREYEKSGAAAAVSFVQASLNDPVDQGVSDILPLLQEAAELGLGDAMHLIAQLTQDQGGAVAVYAKYAKQIASNGDFNALLFALPHVRPAEREDYFHRAIGIMRCDYQSAMTLARAAHAAGMTDKVNQWLGIASHLVGDTTWAMVDLAEAKLAFLGEDASQEVLVLLRSAADAGDYSAQIDLFELVTVPGSSAYDPLHAVAMVQQAIDTQDYSQLAAYLARYRRGHPQFKAQFETALDVPTIYQVAAQAGDVPSMRSFGIYLRESAQDASGLAQATEWLNKAAVGGDATAMAEYGLALAFGLGTEANLPEAKTWLTKAADRGHKRAKDIMTLLTLSRQEKL